MTAQEVYKAIYKSNEEECYNIVYLINNNEIAEAADQIQSRYGCSDKIALEASHIIKTDLINKKKRATANNL